MTSNEQVTVVIGKPSKYKIVVDLTDDVSMVLEDVTQVLIGGVDIAIKEENDNG